MFCPNCGKDRNRVTHTRHENNPDKTRIIRRRICKACGYAWRTVEEYSVGRGPKD